MLVAAGLLTFAASASQAAGLPKEAGLWFDDTGKGAVKIEPCGTGLCGSIVWLKEPLNASGQPLIDRHNPDASKNNRPICGLPILGNLQPVSEGGYDNGWVYDPKVGNTYSVAIKLSDPNTLTVTGYKGVKFLGKSFVWKRAPDTLPLCNAAAAAPAPAPAAAKAAAPAAAGAAAAAAVTPPAAAKPAAPAATAAPASGAAKPPAKKPAAGTAETLPWASGPKPAAPSHLGVQVR